MSVYVCMCLVWREYFALCFLILNLQVVGKFQTSQAHVLVLQQSVYSLEFSLEGPTTETVA